MKNFRAFLTRLFLKKQGQTEAKTRAVVDGSDVTEDVSSKISQVDRGSGVTAAGEEVFYLNSDASVVVL